MLQCFEYLGLAAEKADSTPALVLNPISVATLVGGFMKACNKCGIERPLDDYHRDSKVKDGRQNTCKSCVKASHASPEGRRIKKAANERWKKNNPEKHKESKAISQKKYREVHREEWGQIQINHQGS